MANARDEEALAPQHEEHIHDHLTSLFAEALGVPPDGLDDNFFTLGGHSMMAMHLVSQICDDLKVDLQLREFCEAATLTDVMALVSAMAPQSHG
jgi:acyl carrier protein